MNKQHTIFWIDMLAGPAKSEIPTVLQQSYNVTILQDDSSLGEQISAQKPACVFYDCDYPDKLRLERIRRYKEACPSVPFMLVTLMHSEELAVWTFRNGALDYFVKPFDLDELKQCLLRLQKIVSFQSSRGGRSLYKAAVEIPQSISRSSGRPDDKLAPAIHFVRQNYSKHIFSDAVARQCGLSPTYFSKAFSQRFKMPFQEFLLRYRVAQACLLLENPATTITDVCYAVGFKDPSYFTRVFKRFLGSSPSDYCKSNGSDQLPADFRASIENPSSATSQVVRSLAGCFN